MTARTLAEQLRARRAGVGKWMVRCPAHQDRHPSLAITQGRTAVLLKCWSQGFSVEAICAALSITVSDLFNDHDMTPEQRRRAQLRQAENAEQESRQRRRRIALMKGYRACDRRMDEIAALLLGDMAEDEDTLGKEFHDALEFQRWVVMEVFG